MNLETMIEVIVNGVFITSFLYVAYKMTTILYMALPEIYKNRKEVVKYLKIESIKVVNSFIKTSFINKMLIVSFTLFIISLIMILNIEIQTIYDNDILNTYFRFTFAVLPKIIFISLLLALLQNKVDNSKQIA